MNNKIPNVVKNKIPKFSQFDLLKFDDFILEEEHCKTDWTVIAKKITLNNERYYTISCLINVKNNNEITELLSNYAWNINPQFGIPNTMDIIKSNELPTYLENNIVFKPFVIRRLYNEKCYEKFEIIQNFLLYYNTFKCELKNEYQFIDDDGETTTLVKFECNSELDETVKVNTPFLLNFLRLSKSVLIRFHQFNRQIDDQENINIDLSNNSIDYSTLLSRYKINLNKQQNTFYSTLIGKDIIKPHKLNKQNNKLEYEKFIYSVENSKNIEVSCDEGKLSSYFNENNTPHFLTPIYFRLNVLLNYYNDNTKYKIDERGISCYNIWSLTISRTSEELIQVWLGDLGRIPNIEQKHWKIYNVPPRGSITDYRYKIDIEGSWDDPQFNDLPIYCLLELYKKINVIFIKLYSQELFLQLHKDDIHYVKTLHIPFSDENKEYEGQILALSKIFCDSINVKLIKSIINDYDNNLKSIELLNYLFIEINIKSENKDKLIKILKLIQSLRSTGVAHRKGDNYNKILKNNDLSSKSNIAKIKHIIEILFHSLNDINNELTTISK